MLQSVSETEVAAALTEVVESLSGGETRPGQMQMARSVTQALNTRTHLSIEAGTGVGKSLAYLVPAMMSGRRVVVTTATKVLQDQLANKDLPQVHNALGDMISVRLGRPLRYAVLKGRENYICLLRSSQNASQPELPEIEAETTTAAEKQRAEQLAQIAAWASGTKVGDRAELKFEPEPQVWRQMSVSSAECLGRKKCPYGDRCFSEKAREQAALADVVVTNHHLYAFASIMDGDVLLPEHDFVIIDEAHQLESAATNAFSTEMSPTRLTQLARQLAQIKSPGRKAGGTGLDSTGAGGTGAGGTGLDSATNKERTASLRDLAKALKTALVPFIDDRVTLGTESGGGVKSDDAGSEVVRAEPVAEVLREVDGLLENLSRSLAKASENESVVAADSGSPASSSSQTPPDSQAPLAMLGKELGLALVDIRSLLSPPPGLVTFVDGPEEFPALRMSPINIGGILDDQIWADRTAILTSATIGSHLPEKLGLTAPASPIPASSDEASSDGANPDGANPDGTSPDGTSPDEANPDEANPDRASHNYVQVASTFDYQNNAVLYVAKHLPKPTDPSFRAAAVAEMCELIEAAGGRTLALFTSWKALSETAEALEDKLDSSITVLRQNDTHTDAQLADILNINAASVICATLKFWQGVDIPGPALSLVTIDRLPFAWQGEPIVAARIDAAKAAGENAFMTVQVPHAATLLAQGCGRLIRSASDRGVVAVLDSRLATMRYRTSLLESVPHMKRSIMLKDAVELLRSC